jgi:methylenetetrahydrofolate dehydrogenase (NADP+)/methenyltetrahydrofolate cyclohydrolase
MEQLILSGRPVAEACKETIKTKIDAAKAAGKSVALAILTVGKDPASFVYRGRLLKMAEAWAPKAVAWSLRKPPLRQKWWRRSKN